MRKFSQKEGFYNRAVSIILHVLLVLFQNKYKNHFIKDKDLQKSQRADFNEFKN